MFYARKKFNPRRLPLFFFFVFSPLSFLPWIAQYGT